MDTNGVGSWRSYIVGARGTSLEVAIVPVTALVVPVLDLGVVEVGDDEASGTGGADAVRVTLKVAVEDCVAVRAGRRIARLNCGVRAFFQGKLGIAGADRECHFL